MTGWVQFSAVPGMAVPGMAQPGKDGTGSAPVTWPYLGHVPAFYLDYLDTATQETLAAVPGGSYAMIPVNSRAGLTIPPPDNCWLTGSNHFAPRITAPRPLTREQAMAAHGHYPGSGCRQCHPVQEGPPLAVRVAGPDFAPQPPAKPPMTAEEARAAHGHYPGSECRHCTPLLEEPPRAVRVPGPDFAPQPSLAQVRADLERAKIAHGHYAPGGCRLCLSGGRENEKVVV